MRCQVFYKQILHSFCSCLSLLLCMCACVCERQCVSVCVRVCVCETECVSVDISQMLLPFRHNLNLNGWPNPEKRQ